MVCQQVVVRSARDFARLAFRMYRAMVTYASLPLDLARCPAFVYLLIGAFALILAELLMMVARLH